MRGWVFRAEGFLSELFVTLTGGAFLTGLAVVLGAGPVALALLAALPFLAQAGQLVAPWLERRLGGRRRFVVPALVGARLLWLGPVALLLAGMHGEAAVGLAIAAVFAQAGLGMVAQNGWLAWVSELVPDNEQARLFGQRAGAVALATLVASPLGAWVLDRARERGEEPSGLAMLLGAGVVAGVLGGLTLTRLPDVAPRGGPAAPEAGAGTWRRLGSDPTFRRILLLFGSWNAAIGLPAPFWIYYMIERLGWSFSLVILHGCLVLAVRLLCNGWWARTLEAVGSRRVLIACGFLLALNPVWWLVASREVPWPLWCECLLSGFAWTGFNQAAFIQPIAALRPSDRSRGLALFHVTSGAALFVASLLGGAVLSFADEADEAFLGLFGASALLRAGVALWALRLTEPGVSVRAFFVDFVGSGMLRRPAGRLGALWVLRRRRRSGAGEESGEEAP